MNLLRCGGRDAPWPALAALHACAFASSSAAPWSAQALAGACAAPGGALFRAQDGTPDAAASPLGFALARRIGVEAELLTLAVAPYAQRQGVGGALVGALCAWARRGGAEALFLEVAATAGPARALYAAHGFEQVGRRTAYYRRDGRRADDALVMRFSLQAHGGP